MDKQQFVKQMKRVLWIPGVCPKEKRAEVVAALEAMTEEQFAVLMAAMQKLPKEEVMAAMQSGDTTKLQALMEQHVGQRA